jgi:hypothetical protein
LSLGLVSSVVGTVLAIAVHAILAGRKAVAVELEALAVLAVAGLARCRPSFVGFAVGG